MSLSSPTLPPPHHQLPSSSTASRFPLTRWSSHHWCFLQVLFHRATTSLPAPARRCRPLALPLLLHRPAWVWSPRLQLISPSRCVSTSGARGRPRSTRSWSHPHRRRISPNRCASTSGVSNCLRCTRSRSHRHHHRRHRPGTLLHQRRLHHRRRNRRRPRGCRRCTTCLFSTSTHVMFTLW
jgi:hypothetical protein